jgi:hypothetical protein
MLMFFVKVWVDGSAIVLLATCGFCELLLARSVVPTTARVMVPC